MLFLDLTVNFNFLRTTFLAAKLLGWKVSVKGIRSSLLKLMVLKRIFY